MDPMFKNTCLEEIEKNYMPVSNDNLWHFTNDCLCELNRLFRPDIQNVELFRTSITHDFGIVYPPMLFVSPTKIYDYLRSVLTKLQQEKQKSDEKLKIIEQLRKYGVEYASQEYDPITGTITNTARRYSLDELRKNLKQAEEAKFEVEKIMADKKLMDKLVHWELGGGHGNPPKDVSHYAIRLLKPKLKKLVYELQVEEEVARRIEKLKQDKEKQSFEDAVKKRLAELGYEP